MCFPIPIAKMFNIKYFSALVSMQQHFYLNNRSSSWQEAFEKWHFGNEMETYNKQCVLEISVSSLSSTFLSENGFSWKEHWRSSNSNPYLPLDQELSMLDISYFLFPFFLSIEAYLHSPKWNLGDSTYFSNS